MDTASPAAETAQRAHASSSRVRTPTRTGQPGHRVPGRALNREEVTRIAQALCARDPSGRRDLAMVTKALQHHHLDGWNPTRIAAELNKSRSTISRILRDADTIPTPSEPAPTPPPAPPRISKGSDTESADPAHPGADRVAVSSARSASLSDLSRTP
jgi:ParB-like chromosome segregation protein Spo0J